MGAAASWSGYPMRGLGMCGLHWRPGQQAWSERLMNHETRGGDLTPIRSASTGGNVIQSWVRTGNVNAHRGQLGKVILQRAPLSG